MERMMATDFPRSRHSHRFLVHKKPWFWVVVTSILGLGSMNVLAREVKAVSITSIGLTKDKDASDTCRNFKPSLSQVRDYFSKAYPVPTKWSVHTYYSPCYAEGTIEYADGNRGTWMLSSSGISGIQWAQQGGELLFYETNPWYDPFEGSYGENAGV